ncbi:MAG TPA: hypothetical protein VIQ24_15385 [Pyrinomonadaceae bacterium]
MGYDTHVKRLKNFWGTLITLSVVLIGLQALAAASYPVHGQVRPQAKTKIAAAPKEIKVVSVKPIAQSDPLIVALKSNQEIGLLKNLTWDDAKRVVYQGTDVGAILLPISANKTVVAYYRAKQPGFKVAVMETSGPGLDSVELTFSTADGKAIVGHKLQNGNLSITSMPGKTAGYWDCVHDCQEGTKEFGPSWLKVATSVTSPFETGYKAGVLLGCAAKCW